jgi:hypothetical protein
MKHWVPCLSAIVFVSATVFAQSPDRGAPVRPSTLTLQAAPASGGCPISMSAQHRSNPSLMSARDATPQPLAQRIHLTANGESDSSGILSIKVTVRGTTPKARMLPTSQAGPPDAAMTFDLRADRVNAVASDLLLRGFTSVQAIDLESVTYADGSNWVASAARSCSITPDNLMLISQ